MSDYSIGACLAQRGIGAEKGETAARLIWRSVRWHRDSVKTNLYGPVMDELVLVDYADLSVGGNERAAWESSQKLKHTVQGGAGIEGCMRWFEYTKKRVGLFDLGILFL
jgi:hypothetical protein